MCAGRTIIRAPNRSIPTRTRGRTFSATWSYLSVRGPLGSGRAKPMPSKPVISFSRNIRGARRNHHTNLMSWFVPQHSTSMVPQSSSGGLSPLLMSSFSLSSFSLSALSLGVSRSPRIPLSFESSSGAAPRPSSISIPPSSWAKAVPARGGLTRRERERSSVARKAQSRRLRKVGDDSWDIYLLTSPAKHQVVEAGGDGYEDKGE